MVSRTGVSIRCAHEESEGVLLVGTPSGVCPPEKEVLGRRVWPQGYLSQFGNHYSQDGKGVYSVPEGEPVYDDNQFPIDSPKPLLYKRWWFTVKPQGFRGQRPQGRLGKGGGDFNLVAQDTFYVGLPKGSGPYLPTERHQYLLERGIAKLYTSKVPVTEMVARGLNEPVLIVTEGGRAERDRGSLSSKPEAARADFIGKLRL